MQFGKMHFLSSAEVFSIFVIVTLIGKSSIKKSVKADCSSRWIEEIQIFFILLLIPYLLGLVEQSGDF